MYVLATGLLLASGVFTRANAQTEATWVLPQIEIPLTQGSDTLAVLRPRFASKAADLLVEGNVYQLRVRVGGYRCWVYRADSNEEVARARGLGQVEGLARFADGKEHRIARTGTRRSYTYRWQNGSLKIENGLLTSASAQDFSSLLTQAMLVFSYLQKQYEKEKSVNTQFIPMVVCR